MPQWIELTGFDGCQLACLDFGGDGRAVLMLHGLAGHSRERRDGALWPSFDADVMVECIRELAARSYWAQWRSIRCPTLLVRGDHGHFDQAHYDELAGLLPSARTTTLPDAGHDVHLDAPAQLADAVRRFLEQSQL